MDVGGSWQTSEDMNIFYKNYDNNNINTDDYKKYKWNKYYTGFKMIHLSPTLGAKVIAVIKNILIIMKVMILITILTKIMINKIRETLVPAFISVFFT